MERAYSARTQGATRWKNNMNKQKDIIENEYLNRLKMKLPNYDQECLEAEDELRHLKAVSSN